MILLDTNVLSELMKSEPAQAVLDWISRHGHRDLQTTAVTQAEILYRIVQLPDGRRRRMLNEAADILFAREFTGRILPFDEYAARAYAEIVASRFRQGNPIQTADAMIAAIARTHRAAVATRNVRDFEGCGVALHDPWSES